MRQDVFVVAYQEAKSELLDITCKFEELRQRKERLEGVVAVLGPLINQDEATASVVTEVRPISSPGPAREAEPKRIRSLADAAQPEEDGDSADPFQRRLRDALKFSSPRREGLLNAI